MGLTKVVQLLQISRLFGFIPLLIWGVMGSPIPHKAAVHIVLGSPIHVKQADMPAANEVEATLQEFVGAIKALYEEHKAKAGYPDSVHLYVH